MPLLNLILIALIQGITEFLPVSSSGHLILLPALSGLDDQGQAIDVAVHVGTLGAVVVYFRQDVARAAAGLPALLRGRLDDPGARLLWLLAVATIPVVLAGLVFKLSGLSDALRSITVIGWTMLIFGLVLWWADRVGSRERQVEDWTLKEAVIMGLWQAVALIPGTSRSGITITGARFLGYERKEAGRLAMLMSIPTIAASGVLLGIEVVADADTATLRDGLIGAVFAFVAALVALKLMFRFLERFSYTPYVIYRIALGLILLGIAYT